VVINGPAARKLEEFFKSPEQPWERVNRDDLLQEEGC